MLIKRKKIFILVIPLLFLLLMPAAAPLGAQGLQDAFKTGDNESPLDKAAGAGGAGYNTENADTQFDSMVATVIRTVLSLLGVIFLILIIYGGITWMTAGGNEDRIARARKILTAAVIGLIIVVAAYAISYFVIEALTDTTLEQGSSGGMGEPGGE